MRRGGTCGHEGVRSFHAVATHKEAEGRRFADSQLQVHVSGLGLALKSVGRMGGAPHRKRTKSGGIAGGISGLRINNITLIQCDKVVL